MLRSLGSSDLEHPLGDHGHVVVHLRDAHLITGPSLNGNSSIAVATPGVCPRRTEALRNVDNVDIELLLTLHGVVELQVLSVRLLVGQDGSGGNHQRVLTSSCYLGSEADNNLVGNSLALFLWAVVILAILHERVVGTDKIGLVGILAEETLDVNGIGERQSELAQA